MIKITVEASNVNKASEFLQKHFDLIKMISFVAPNINAGVDVIFSFVSTKEEIKVEVKKLFNIMKNFKGAPTLRENCEKSGFSESKLDKIFLLQQ